MCSRVRAVTAVASVTLWFGIAFSACGGKLGGLSGDSTCEQFNKATDAEQNEVISALVRARNPLRQGNALMQITSVCRTNPTKRLDDIAI